LKEDHRQNFLDAVQSIAESVFDFHDRWNLLDEKKPAHIAIEERKELLLEEVNELNDEINKIDEDKSIKLLSREAADVLYVSVGHLLALRNEGLEAMYQVSKKIITKLNKHIFLIKKRRK
tara:strand:- start:2394 stop:2753 length:360 start_codon:yes stop_codon:yes gene_type:complete